MLALGFLVVIVIIVRGIHPFLALTNPMPGGLLVVEGWAQDDALRAAVAEFNRNHYERVYVTGGPLIWGGPLSEYKTYAEGGAATLIKLGLSTNEVQAVPSKRVLQDRTYASALSLKYWLVQHGIRAAKIHLLSEGPHARRSRLLFKKALGESFTVGVTALPVADYDANYWWRSSSGVRAVIGESIAYLYARLLFRPPKNLSQS